MKAAEEKATPQADLLTLLALSETKLLSGRGGRAVQDLSALLCLVLLLHILKICKSLSNLFSHPIELYHIKELVSNRMSEPCQAGIATSSFREKAG